MHKGVTLLWIFQTIKVPYYIKTFIFLRHTTSKDGNLSVLLNFLYQSVWLNITILVQGLKYQISSRSQVWIRLAWGSCLDIMSKIFLNHFFLSKIAYLSSVDQYTVELWYFEHRYPIQWIRSDLKVPTTYTLSN